MFIPEALVFPASSNGWSVSTLIQGFTRSYTTSLIFRSLYFTLFELSQGLACFDPKQVHRLEVSPFSTDNAIFYKITCSNDQERS